MNSFKTTNFTFLSFLEMDENMAKEVWECRNMVEVRENMTNPEPISWVSHAAFIKSLSSNDKKFYFCVLNEGRFIGSVNLEFLSSDAIERGIYIHPALWGRGLAKALSKELYEYLGKNGVRKVLTKIKKENSVSIALQKSLGAEEYSKDENYRYFKVEL